MKRKLYPIVCSLFVLAIVSMSCSIGAPAPEPTVVPTYTAYPTYTPYPTDIPPTEIPPTRVPPTAIPPTRVPVIESVFGLSQIQASKFMYEKGYNFNSVQGEAIFDNRYAPVVAFGLHGVQKVTGISMGLVMSHPDADPERAGELSAKFFIDAGVPVDVAKTIFDALGDLSPKIVEEGKASIIIGEEWIVEYHIIDGDIFIITVVPVSQDNGNNSTGNSA